MWLRLGWHRSRQVWIAVLVLPALLFRAAIPAGFMPMPGVGGWPTLELCPATLSAHGQDHVPCLFAASAGAAPPPHALDAPSAAPDQTHARLEATETVFARTILRAQRARAPPVPRNA